MMFIAIKTEDGAIRGKFSFCCRIPKVARQGFYKYLADKDRPWKYQDLADAMREIAPGDEYNGTYGRIRMFQALLLKQPEGAHIPEERTVYYVMEKIGLIHRPKCKPNGTTKADREARKSDDLLERDFTSAEPLKKCITDITEIKAKDGKPYVSAIFDCFDAAVLGLAMDTNGNRRATKLTRLDVQKFVNQMVDKSLAPKTVKNYYSVLCGIMDFAVHMGIINETPCNHIKLPKGTASEAQYYTIEEVNLLLSALEKIPPSDLKYKVMILIALFGGFRKSEILGLNWEDINLETGAMHICRSRHAKKGGGVYEDTPKTDRSNRDIALPREILSFLRELKVQQLEEKLIYGNRYTDSPALIKNRFGEPLHPHSPYKWLKQFTESAGIRDIGLHGLRHPYVKSTTKNIILKSRNPKLPIWI